MKNGPILVLNAGSSTVKIGIFTLEQTGVIQRFTGLLDKHGKDPHLQLRDPRGKAVLEVPAGTRSDKGILGELFMWADQRPDLGTFAAVGHRVVHGGPDFAEPVILAPDIVRKLADLAPLAPLHQQECLDPILEILSRDPTLTQIACFDTAFHRTIDETTRLLPLPRRFEGKGIRKYGFHGLSYEYISMRLPEISPQLATGRTVVAHLGSGASLCAIRGCVSVDTTMGLTPLDGLMMATRSGSIDPGALLYLLAAEGMSRDELQHMLYHESGLLGVSGISGDMRTLLQSSDPEASAAIELFCRRVAAGITSMAHSLEGLDGIVFTGGIGENSDVVRFRILKKLSWLGVRTDDHRDSNGDGLSRPATHIEIRVIRTDEAAVIAAHTAAVLRHSLTPGRPPSPAE